MSTGARGTKKPPTHDRLSAVDALFLHAESDIAPMHIGIVGIYRGHIPLQGYREFLGRRMHLIPRYRQCITPVPLHLALPTWEDDPAFDICRHVHEIQLPAPGSDPQLRKLAERLFSERLPLDRPVWEQYLIRGLPGNRTAIFSKLHHALADGVSSVDILRAMHDDGPETKARRAPAYRPRPTPGAAGRLANSIAEDLALPLRSAIGMIEDFTQLVEGAVRGGLQNTLAQAAGAVREYFTPFRPMPFNVWNLSGQKHVGWSDLPLERLRETAHALGGTLNDAILTIVGGGVLRYLTPRGAKTEERDLHITIPVNVRRGGDAGRPGNQISIQPVCVPLNSRGALERFEAINRQTRALKSAHVADGMHLLFHALESLPPPIQYGLISLYSHPFAAFARLGVNSFPTQHAICTNVPGPAGPLYTLGHECLSLRPMAPVIAGMGLLFGCISYNGTVYFASVADKAAVPDIQRMKRCIDAACREFLAATPATRERKNAARSAKPRARRKKPTAARSR